MRIAVAFRAIIEGIGILAAPNCTFICGTMALIAILAGAALLLGFLTPIMGALAAVRSLFVGVSLLLASGANIFDKEFSAIDSFVLSVALILLGPGAMSLDAYLFGRREIIIPQTSRPPRP